MGGSTSKSKDVAPVITSNMQTAMMPISSTAFGYYFGAPCEVEVAHIRVTDFVDTVIAHKAQFVKRDYREDEEDITFRTWFKLSGVDSTGYDAELLGTSFVASTRVRDLLRGYLKAKAAPKPPVAASDSKSFDKMSEIDVQLNEGDDPLDQRDDQSEAGSVNTLVKTIVTDTSLMSAAGRKRSSQPGVKKPEKTEGALKTRKAIEKVLSERRMLILDSLLSLLGRSKEDEAKKSVIIGVIRDLLIDAISDQKSSSAVMMASLARLSADSSMTHSINQCVPSHSGSVVASSVSESLKDSSAVEKIKYLAMLALTFSQKPLYLLPFNTLNNADQQFAQDLQRKCESILNELMISVLSPLCCAYIATLRETPDSSASRVDNASRYALICDLITGSVCDNESVEDIVARAPRALQSYLSAKRLTGNDFLASVPNAQDKKDFMLCFSSVINEFPRYLLNAPDASTDELITIGKANVHFAKTLLNQGNKIKTQVLAPLTEEDEASLTPQAKRK